MKIVNHREPTPVMKFITWVLFVVLFAFNTPLMAVQSDIITSSYTLGSSGFTTVLDGNSDGGYFVKSGGALTISNAVVRNFQTRGGTGSGGGAGLGGAVFVDSNASVTISNVLFSGNGAIGGSASITSKYGGTLNGRFTATTDFKASNGIDRNKEVDNLLFDNDGNGGNGNNGSDGYDPKIVELAGNHQNGIAGGNGTAGEDAWSWNPIAVAQVVAAGVSLFRAVRSTTEPATEAAAAAANPFTGNIAASKAVAIALRATDIVTSTKDLALAVIELTSWQTALSKGAVGLGGEGGQGGNGGNGTGFFGGGYGGDGGSGGDGAGAANGGNGGGGGNGGAGGFGGGGGQGGNGGSAGKDGGSHPDTKKGAIAGVAGNGGAGGFGGGVGSQGAGYGGDPEGKIGGGGGGAGYGGSIFVKSAGTLTVTGNTRFTGGFVSGGTGTSYSGTVAAGPSGDAAGTDLFMQKGSTVILSPGAGNKIVFDGTIADDSAGTISVNYANENLYTLGNGAGLKISDGLVIFNNTNTYTGVTEISTGGVLQAQDGVGVHANSNIKFTGGVLQSNGIFNRVVGTESNRVQWAGSGGFAASGGDLVVALSGSQQLTWGGTDNLSKNFVGASDSLIFGSDTATNSVTFINEINLGSSGTRNIQVVRGATQDAVAILNGTLSGSAGLSLNTVGDPFAGTLVLRKAETYTGGTTINAGILRLENRGALPTSGIVTVNGELDLSTAGNGSNNAALANHTGDRTIGGLAGTDSSALVDMGAFILTINQTANTSYAGNLVDGGINGGSFASLVKLGAGALTLAGGNNTYLGSTTVSAGSLVLDTTAVLLSATLTVSSGATFEAKSGSVIPVATALELDGTAVFRSPSVAIDTLNGGATGVLALDNALLSINSGTYSGVITNGASTGALAKEGDGKLTLSGVNTYTGKTWVNSGTLSVSGGGLQSSEVAVVLGALYQMATGTSIVNTTKFTLDGAVELNQSSQTIDILNGSSTATVKLSTTALTVNSGTFAGVISDTGSLIKESAGTLILSGSNSYSGTTTINNGILKLGANEVLPNGNGKSSVTITSPGILDLAGFSETINGLYGTGTVYSSGSAGLLSTLSLGSGDADGAFSGAIQNGAGKVALTKLGTGTQDLSGTNTFTGDVNINVGKLRISNGAAINDVVLVNLANTAGATFELLSNETIGALAGGGTLGGLVTLNNNVLTVGNTLGSGDKSSEYAGVITGGIALGSDQLVKQGLGTLTLSGSDTFTGDTRIKGGTLELKGGAALNDQVAVILQTATVSTLKVSTSEVIGSLAGGAGGGLVSLSGNTLSTGINNTSTTYEGIISGSNSFGFNNLVKQGAGKFTLSGPNTFTGDVQIQGGSLEVRGSSALWDTVAVKLDATSGVTFLVSDDETIGSLAGGSLTAGLVQLLTNKLTVGNNNQSTEYAGTIDGTLGLGNAQLVKQGSGRLTLSGSNTFDGDARILAGTLMLKNSQALNDQVAVVVSNASGATMELASSERIGSLAGGGSIGGLAKLNDKVLLTGTNNTTTEFAGVVTGSAGLLNVQFIKEGSGTMTLSGTNTFDGYVQIDLGTLDLKNGRALADNVAVVLTDNAAATLNLTTSETIGSLQGGIGGGVARLNGQVLSTGTNNLSTTFAGVISGSIALNTTQFIKQGSGVMTLSGANTFTGDVQIQAGTLNLVGSAALNDQVAVKLDNTSLVTLNLTDSEVIGSLNGGTLSQVWLNAKVLSTGINNNSTTYAGVITGNAGLNQPQFVKQGNGTMTLSGSNTFNGNVQISGGTLNLVGGAALNDRVAVTLDNTSNVVLNLTNSETIGSLAGGTLSQVKLNGQVITAGTNDNTTTYAGVISGSVALGTAQLIKQGTGTMTLSGANTFTGDARIDAGTLDLSGGLALADTVAVVLTNNTNVKLNISTSETIGSLAGVGPNGLVALGAQTLTLGFNNTSTEFAGKMTGSVSGTNLVKIGTGTTTLSGSNEFTGGVLINAGTLDLKNGAALADVVAVTLANVAGANLNLTNSETIGSLAGGGTTGGNVSLNSNLLTFGDVTNQTFGGVISGNGAIVKQGVGTTTFTNVSTFTGGGTITTGTLALQGAGKLADAGNVLVGTLGTFDVSQANGGRTLANLSGSGLVRTGSNALTVGSGTNSIFYGRINDGGLSGFTGGSLAKTGVGTFNLAGSSNLQTINVNAGNLTVSGNSLNLSSTATVNVATGATLDLENQNTIGTLNSNGVLKTAGAAGAKLTATTYNLLDGTQVGLDLGTGTINSNGQVLVNSNLNASQITINGGSFKLGIGASVLPTVAVNITSSLGTFAIDGAGSANSPIVITSLSGTGTVYQGSAFVTITGVNTFGGQFITSSVLAAGSASATVAGTLTVTGNVTSDVKISSGGSLNLTGSGSNQLSGGLDVNSGGAVTVGTSSGVSTNQNVNNSGNLTNGGSIAITGSSSLTNGGTFANTGSITTPGVTNSGSLTNTGSITTTTLTNSGTGKITNAGGTIVATTGVDNSGTLVNNGTIQGSLTSSGTFAGTGLVSGSANVSGTFSPGNSPGKVSIGGTLTLGGSLFTTNANFELSGTNNVSNVALTAGTNSAVGAYFDQVSSSKVTVGSNVDLNLSIFVGASGTLTLAAGQAYKIINTGDGLIGGTFAHVRSVLDAASPGQSQLLPTGIVFNSWTGDVVATGVTWNGTSWNITTDLLPASLGGWASLNANQRAILTQVNVAERQFQGGTLVKLLLAAPNAEAAKIVLDKASPEAFVGLGDFGLNVGRSQLEQARTMENVTEDGRFGVFSGWSNYSGGANNSVNRANYSLSNNSAILGLRYAFAGGLVANIFATEGGGSVHTDFLRADVDGQTVGLGATYSPGNESRFSFHAGMLFGSFDNKGTRVTNSGISRFTSANVSTFHGSMGTEMSLVRTPEALLSTDLTMTYGTASVGSINETGFSGENLSIHSQSPSSFVIDLGIRGSYRINPKWGINGRLSLEHDFDSAHRDVSANVIGEQTAFGVRAPGMGDTHFSAEFGTRFDFTRRFSVGVNFKGTVGSDSKFGASTLLNAAYGF